MIKLWLVKRTDRINYDEWDSMVVAAETELEARCYHPGKNLKARKVEGYWKWFYIGEPEKEYYRLYNGGWGAVEDLNIEYLGHTDRKIAGVILASFNAG